MKTILTVLKRNMRKKALAFISFCFFPCLQGCVAALPMVYSIFAAANYAVGGFVAYKSIQMTTGGEAEVRFKDEKMSTENQRALSSLENLAIYPEGRKDVKLAEVLSSTGRFNIITPYSVREALPDTGSVADIRQMTSQEKRSYALDLCRSLNADGIFIYTEGGHTYDTSYWSLKKPEAAVKFQANVYSVQQNGIIWTQEGEIALKTGSSMPSQDEVDQIAVSAIARLWQDRRA